MLRTSNQIRGVTHVIAGSIDVSWLVGTLYQNTGIHISYNSTCVYYYTT